MTRPTFIIFSGHNDRAVVALCRFFQRSGNAFVLVSSGPADPIHRTAWAKDVAFCRLSRQLGLSLFEDAVAVCGEGPAVYCPTTEFMNQFVLENRSALEAIGLVVPLCPGELYARLTSKFDSMHAVQELAPIQAPRLFGPDPREWRAPCVIKPRANTDGRQVFYPILCATREDLQRAISSIPAAQWFCQEWIDGQSYYLCAYVSRAGQRAHFWQENILQQPGGKSIVLARSVPDPGLGFDAGQLLDSLHVRGFSGAFMMEVIRDALGRVYYIEINPRLWGPLQLSLAACPALLSLFATDWGGKPLDAANGSDAAAHWYAWLYGASNTSCRRYPAAAALRESIQDLLVANDVYRDQDTRALHGVH